MQSAWVQPLSLSTLCYVSWRMEQQKKGHSGSFDNYGYSGSKIVRKLHFIHLVINPSVALFLCHQILCTDTAWLPSKRGVANHLRPFYMSFIPIYTRISPAVELCSDVPKRYIVSRDLRGNNDKLLWPTRGGFPIRQDSISRVTWDEHCDLYKSLSGVVVDYDLYRIYMRGQFKQALAGHRAERKWSIAYPISVPDYSTKPFFLILQNGSASPPKPKPSLQCMNERQSSWATDWDPENDDLMIWKWPFFDRRAINSLVDAHTDPACYPLPSKGLTVILF